MPNTLFISYSRKQQDQAIQLDNIKLMQFFWWMDYRIVGTVDWWKNICETIEESFCMIALMSKTYTESVYCMGELQYALKLNKPVLCLMLEPDVKYPTELNDKRVQYINLHEWDVNRVIQTILESMYRVERDYNDKVYHKDVSLRPYLRPPVPTPPTQTASEEDREIVAKVHNAQARPAPPIRISEAIIKATQALDREEYDRVIELLEPVRPHAKDTDQEIIHDLLREARLGQDYAKIAALVQSARMRARGCEQYVTFKKAYPDYPDAANLTAICEPPAPPSKPAASVGVKRRTILGILPPPFAWIEIPAGKVTLGTSYTSGYITKPTEFNVPAFAIAKYPITNAQFAKFIEAGGYKQKKWWTDEGWEACEQGWAYVDGKWKPTGKPWTEPRYWQDKKWNGAEYPVVGVSWYESIAFCLWLSEVASDKITLPTEQQWQRAAQGDTNSAYPWGDLFDAKRCNSSVGQDWRKNSTSPVIHYEGKGDSLFGVVDMSGNVWEWCLTEYESGSIEVNRTNARVLRGGSWYSNYEDGLRADYRSRYFPDYRIYLNGFRLVRS